MSTIGNRIKRCRLALEMPKATLASKAGITRPCVTYYENFGREPSSSALGKLADALNTSADYLLGVSDDKEYLKDPIVESMLRSMSKLKGRDIKFMQRVCKAIKNIKRKPNASHR